MYDHEDYCDEGNVWITKEGARIRVRELNFEHLLNIHSMLSSITDRRFQNNFTGILNDVDYWWGVIDQEIKRRKVIQIIETNRFVRRQVVSAREVVLNIRPKTIEERITAIEDYIQEL